MTANTGRADPKPRNASPSSSSAHRHSSAKHAARMRRRSRLSARCPAGRISSTNGRNCESPIRPRSSGSRVDLVDLPADGHRLHLHGQRRQEARAEEKGEIAIAQHGAARVGRCVHSAAQRVIGFISRGRIARSDVAPTLRRRRCDHCPEALACCWPLSWRSPSRPRRLPRSPRRPTPASKRSARASSTNSAATRPSTRPRSATTASTATSTT